MKRLPFACLLAGLSSVEAVAGPADSAIVAAMRLAEQPNYSWTSTVADDARTYDIEGKTARGGFTLVRMPVINAVRRQLGRGATDAEVDFVFLGNVACVLASDHGWLRPDELPAAPEDRRESGGRAGRRGSRGGPGSGPSGGRRGPGAGAEDGNARGYSNLQLAISHPHEELGVMVSSHTDLTVDGDVVSGTLTDLGAQLLLVHDGQKELTPVRATGTFTWWIRDGAILKYQVSLHGVLEIETSRGRQQIEVRQKSDTRLKAVGTTTFEVPEPARLKLQR
jgi:hypothetical protein